MNHSGSTTLLAREDCMIIEDQAFLRTYDSAPPPPPFPSTNYLSLSVFLCVACVTRGGGAVIEPNHTTTKKLGLLPLYKFFIPHTLVSTPPHPPPLPPNHTTTKKLGLLPLYKLFIPLSLVLGRVGFRSKQCCGSASHRSGSGCASLFELLH